MKNEIINSRNNSNNNIKKRKNTNIIIVKNEINSVKNSEKISFPPIKKKKKITIRRSSKTTFLSKKPIDKLKLSDKEINANLSNKNDLVLQKKSYENSDISIYSKENMNQNIMKEIPVNLKFHEDNALSKNLSDYELNELEYKEALKIDNRTFIQIYYANLKRENIILFTFFQCNDYNLLYIKIARFIFLLTTDMAMNVFFFLMNQCINYF